MANNRYRGKYPQRVRSIGTAKAGGWIITLNDGTVHRPDGMVLTVAGMAIKPGMEWADVAKALKHARHCIVQAKRAGRLATSVHPLHARGILASVHRKAFIHAARRVYHSVAQSGARWIASASNGTIYHTAYSSLADASMAAGILNGQSWAQSLRIGDVFRGCNGQARHEGITSQWWTIGAHSILANMQIYDNYGARIIGVGLIHTHTQINAIIR